MKIDRGPESDDPAVSTGAGGSDHPVMDRRVFITLLGGSVLATPLAGEAQPTGKIRRIGILWAYFPSIAAPFGKALRQGLRDAGYVEGQNILVEERWAEDRLDRLPTLAAELLRLDVDLIVTASTPAVRAAQRASKTVPIVMTLVSDPVEDHIVTSLARPGGNVTGLSLMHPELSGKRLALLKEVVAKLTRVTVFWSSSTPAYKLVLSETETAARALGVQLRVVEVRGPGDLDSAFAAITRERTGALVVLPDPMFRNQHGRIIDLAAKNRLPVMYWSRELVEAGGLMAYGASFPDVFRQAATFVDKILKGAKPGDLPIEQPARLELAVNLKTAKALGLAIPPSVLGRADYVIE